MQLKGLEKNYPVHEKELLAVIQALKKWRSDLLGIPIYVYTDHRTLQNFDTQRDLSRRQLRWQEFMLQYDMTIILERTTPSPMHYLESRMVHSQANLLINKPLCFYPTQCVPPPASM
jgi:hypothetical protein